MPANGDWSHRLLEDPDGTLRVEVVDEDGVVFPIARRVTRGQAAVLVRKIGEESQQSRRPVRAVIRDAAFMAAIVLTVKRRRV